MRRFKFLPVLLALFVLCGGCGTENAALDASALPKDDGATEITIEVMNVGGFYQEAAQKFEELTGVKVNVINHYSAAKSVEEQDYAYLERIPGELMVGKGADIYANIDLDFAKIGGQGYLCNLADWIAAESDISDDIYYMDILESGFNQGDMYSFPLTMFFMALGTDIEIPDLDGKNLSWEEFFDLTKGINRNGVLVGMSDYEIFSQRFRDRYDSFIDVQNKTENLNTPEMVHLLEQCKAWSEQGLCIPYNADNFASMFDNAFIKQYGGGIELLINITLAGTTGGATHYYDIPSDSGITDKSNKVLKTDLICINAASAYKGTAWKFVKFLLSKDVQATSYFVPIHREVAADHILSTFGTGYSKSSTDVKQAIKETETILDAIKKTCNIGLSGIEKVVFNQEAQRFFTNEISAEEAAKNMADAVKLYIMEQ